MATPTAQHRTQLAKNIFLLRILEDGKAHPVPKNIVASRDGVFQLPVAPQSITPRQSARAGYLETHSGAIADILGVAPPEWEIVGQMPITPTTANKVTLSGFAWQHQLEEYILYFLKASKERARDGKSLLEMRFHDFYAAQHWSVLPMAVPLGVRSSDSPLTERYTLRLKGLLPVASVPSPRAPVRHPRSLKQKAEEALAAMCQHPTHQQVLS